MDMIFSRVIDEMGRYPTGWRREKGIHGGIRMEPREQRPMLLVLGQRDREAGSDVYFRVWQWMDTNYCDNSNYIELQVQNAYLSLMQYTNCACEAGRIRWFPDSEGALVVPEYVTNRCVFHRNLHGDDE